jgi:UDP-N-acetyl-D-galactosamine dehydrogenase
MNELAIIFDRLGIDTLEVLEAAGTKWNFLPFRPGLVGGHCIGVDPYYLTTKAQELGLSPQVILAGRGVNDSMGEFVAAATVKELARRGGRVGGSKVVILGLAFKEDVRDLRNSRVPDIVAELREHAVDVRVHDELVDPQAAAHEYGLQLAGRDALAGADAVVLAVPHRGMTELARELVGETGILIDVKSRVPLGSLPSGVCHWRL